MSRFTPEEMAQIAKARDELIRALHQITVFEEHVRDQHDAALDRLEDAKRYIDSGLGKVSPVVWIQKGQKRA